MRRIGIGTVLLVLGATLACDSIESLRQRFFGSGTSEEQEPAEIAEVRSLYEQGRFEEAIRNLEQMTSADPNSATAFYYLGLCYLADAGEDPDPRSPLSPAEAKSRDAFERALALNPRYSEAAIGLGDLYFRRAKKRPRRDRNVEPSQDPFQIALESYEKAVAIDPKHSDAQLHYARFLDRAGRTEEAERAYRAAVEASATIPEVAPDYYLAYGRFLASQPGRLQEAIDQFEMAQMFRRDDPGIQREIAVAYGRVGQQYFDNEQYSLAEQSLNMAYGLFPDKSVPEAQKVAETLKQLRSIRSR